VQADRPPGLGIAYLGLVDGLLLFVILLLGSSLLISQRTYGRVQGIVTLVVALVWVVLSALLALSLLLLTIELFVAVPFGTLGLSDDLTTVVGDLVDNALDALGQNGSATPGGRIEVGLREEGGDVVVVVQDTGPGVPTELVDKLFERGFTTKAEGGGQGLGLALTRSICQRRGGGVRVFNQDGALFSARLPREPVSTP
jgi:signal transduction histidine kinase